MNDILEKEIENEKPWEAASKAGSVIEVRANSGAMTAVGEELSEGAKAGMEPCGTADDVPAGPEGYEKRLQ